MTAVIGDLIPSADSFQVDAGFKMGAAQAAIRKHCGWHVAPSVTRTIRLDGHGGDSLLLPSKHVTALSSLKLDGVEHVQDARFSEAGSLVLVNGATFPDLPGSVEATITDGWDLEDVPEVQMILLDIASRVMQVPGTVSSQSTNGSSVTYRSGSDGGVPNVALFDSEKRTLQPYRLSWGVKP
ncbi:hypothetical protein [Bifidobacterium longum]|jgi:hypothetical protein|uniref:hypothetical protein n=1 Tax=Bifidobacterium longum TaxID=216816 RepID=UPI002024E9AB|nr:hypothetical protein [Bifidobacterium longum]DAZ05342.1 MAG TPA: head to tail adaptor [Caudoviricetes sp.]